MPVKDILNVENMQMFMINEDGTYTPLGDCIKTCDVELTTEIEADNKVIHTFNPNKSCSFDVTLEDPMRFRRFIKNLTPKKHRRIIHNLFHHKDSLVRKKSMKRLLKLGYKIIGR